MKQESTIDPHKFQEKYDEAINRNDAPSVGKLFTDDAIGEWSQTIPVESGDPIKMKSFWSTIDIRQGEDWKMRMLTWNITPETNTVNNK
jgi:hypothetical protein